MEPVLGTERTEGVIRRVNAVEELDDVRELTVRVPCKPRLLNSRRCYPTPYRRSLFEDARNGWTQLREPAPDPTHGLTTHRPYETSPSAAN